MEAHAGAHLTVIDLCHESPRPLREIADLLGRHISCVYRWTNEGSRGRVLEYVQIGGRRYTTMEALQRFAEASIEPDADPGVRLVDRAAEAAEELKGYGL